MIHIWSNEYLWHNTLTQDGSCFEVGDDGELIRRGWQSSWTPFTRCLSVLPPTRAPDPALCEPKTPSLLVFCALDVCLSIFCMLTHQRSFELHETQITPLVSSTMRRKLKQQIKCVIFLLIMIMNFLLLTFFFI